MAADEVDQTPFRRGSGGNGRAVLHSGFLDILPLLNRICVCGKLAL